MRGDIMITEKLALEKDVVVNNIDDALHSINTDFKVQKHGTDLNEVELTAEGQISFGGEKFPLTDWAFESICSLTKIPKEFARRIPVQLLLDTFNTLKVEHNQRIIFLISRQTVINVLPHPYIYAENKEVLEQLDEILGNLSLELQEIRISDRGMTASFLKEGVKVEPVPGDITRVGLNVLNSETGFRGTKASFWLLRLVCSNGATLTNNWGNVEWSYDHRVSRERSMRNFVEGILKLQLDFDRLTRSYQKLVERELMAFEFVNVWRRLARIVGNDEADCIADIQRDERNRLNNEVREGNRSLNTGMIIYDMHNSITQAARRYSFVARRRLEGLGGALIDLAQS